MTWFCIGKGANCSVDPCVGEACEFYNGQGARRAMTRGDEFRSMSDEELAAKIEDLLPKLMEAGDMTLIEKICDGQGCGEDRECTTLLHRACIMRYLNQPAEDDYGNQ